MRFERAAKFGLFAAVGLSVVSVLTFLLVKELQSNAMRQSEAATLTALVGLAGSAVALGFLFTVIGEYVDRKLAARGLGGSEE